jgi:hypothetical protein
MRVETNHAVSTPRRSDATKTLAAISASLASTPSFSNDRLTKRISFHD